LYNKEITFTIIDTRGDRRMMAKEGIYIPSEYHVDIKDIFNVGVRC
jgi:hypothetical protein